MTSLTLTGNGQAQVTNIDGSALVTVDASALGGTYALGADKGDTTFGLNYWSTSAKSETVKLGSGIDWINLQNSTVKNMDTVPEVRMHDLRHSTASFLVNSGRSLYEVQKILGHTQLKTTQRYAHLSQATLLEAVDSLGQVSGLSLAVA